MILRSSDDCIAVDDVEKVEVTDTEPVGSDEKACWTCGSSVTASLRNGERFNDSTCQCRRLPVGKTMTSAIT
jgi:NAD-dependent dihydropyrimidine dehydrogenase PreA subunit